jgi:hypothetical protein
MNPRDVDRLRPTDVVAILGLDRTLTVVARPLGDDEFIDLQTGVVPDNLWTPPPRPGEQRLRTVMLDG